MKFAIIFVFTSALAFTSAFAEDSSKKLALKMATESVDQSFEAMKPMLEASFEKMDREASKPGVPPSGKIWAQEFRNSLNRETMISLIAKNMQEIFTSDELLEIQRFKASPLGIKADQFFKHIQSSDAIGKPVIAMVCDRTKARMKSIDMPSDAFLEGVCPK